MRVIDRKMDRWWRRATHWLLCGSGLFVGLGLNAAGQQGGGEEAPALEALRISAEEAPFPDGRLQEAVWPRAPSSGHFIQREPHAGRAASETTEIRVLYTDEALYLGIRCLDSRPELIRATELRRDDPMDNDDVISILLDTFHDHRNAFLFRTNPLGTQYDALVTDESQHLNAEWDEKGLSTARIADFGWEVEIQVPLKSLRGPERERQDWGLNVERIIRRKNEATYWAGWSQDYKFHHVSQAGHLADLRGVKTGLRLRIKPFAVGGFTQQPDASGSDYRDESQLGLEDVKVSLTPSVTADFTVNPDFAQTEVEPFPIHPRVAIPPGAYDFTSYTLRLRSFQGRSLSGELEIEAGDFFDGSIFSVSVAPLLKINQHLSLQLDYQSNNVKLPAGSFVARVLNSRFNYNFNTRLLTSATLQYENVAERFLVNVRFNYIYRPGDDLFVVYNETRDLGDGFGGLINRTLLVKFNHSFDF